jgi:hypothetical protein
MFEQIRKEHKGAFKHAHQNKFFPGVKFIYLSGQFSDTPVNLFSREKKNAIRDPHGGILSIFNSFHSDIALLQINFETPHSELTAKMNFAYSSCALPTLALSAVRAFSK